MVVLLALTILAASSMNVTLPEPGYARASRPADTLKGFNKITFSDSTVMPVRMPRDTKISTKGGGITASSGLREQEDLFHLDNPDISISGRGRVTGFALVAKNAAGANGRAMLLGVNMNFCQVPGCSSQEDPYFYLAGFLESEGERFIIPKGDYLLYGISDGAPVTVTLQLHGLPGRAKLQPRGVTRDVTVSTPPESLTEANTRAGHSYGEPYESSGAETLMLTASRIRGDSWVNGRYGMCLYNDEPITPRPIAYSYPCIGGFGVYIGDGFVRSVPYQNLFNTAVHTTSENGGTWALGGGYLAAAQVSEFEAVQLHIALPNDIATAAPVQSNECARWSHKPSEKGEGGVCLRLPRLQDLAGVRRLAPT